MRKESHFFRLMNYAGNFRYFTYISWFLSCVSSFLSLIPFIYIWKIVEELLNVAPNFSYAKNVVSNGWFAVFFAVLSLIIYILGLLCSHIAAFRIASRMRSLAMKHIASLPMGKIEEIGSGKLRKIVNESSSATETYLAHILIDKVGAITTSICLIFLMFTIDIKLGMVSIFPVILGFSILRKITGNQMKLKLQQYQNALDDMFNEAVEYIRGIPVVKTFGQTIFTFKKFKESIEMYGRWVSDYTLECRKFWLLYVVAVNSIFAFLIFAGIYLVYDGITKDFILNIIFYIIVTPVVIISLNRIMHMSEESAIVNDALGRFDGLMSIDKMKFLGKYYLPSSADIKIDNISYSYNSKNKALDNISLRIAEGETVAFVGPSGGGKTTLACLISRFFDPQEGTVSIGGIDIRKINKKDLMNTISFLFQDSRVIKGSIFENVRLAKPQASRNEVLKALIDAQCQDILNKFPMGLDTIIGTDGVYLSGGEQQRIAIARIFLKQSPIIILDEATAFADPDNELRVQKAFAELAKNRTVIFIAHRLSTIINVDKIFVLKNGKIIEQGDFLTLKDKGGLFTKMWNDYQLSIEWKVKGGK